MVFKLWITRIEFNTKKEWTTESHNDTDEISMYFSKWNKSVHKCFYCIIPFIVVQLLSCVLLFQPHELQHTRFPCPSLSPSVLKLLFTESLMPSNHLVLCCPLFLLPSTWTSIRVFPKELALHIRWPKYWSFSFSISPYNEYSGLISWLAGPPCCPKDSQKSSLAAQSESINSLALSLLYSPALTSIHDHWKNHSLD